MKRIFTFISLMFFAFSIAEAQQNNISLNEFKIQNPDLDHFHSIDNHHYFIKDELISWTDAKNYGDQIGVSMYIINSSDEENEVYTNLPLSGNNGFGYLIGLYQDTNDTSYSEPDGGWKWIDGTSLTYSNWEPNEPNNANNGEDYAHFDWQEGGVKWNDIASSPNVNKAIYEFVDYSADILLNGTVSAESNQIKNVADPINAQDVATKSYVDSNINSFSGSYNDLTDTPTMYTQAQVDALISNLQSQISDLKGEVVDNEGNVYSSVQLGDQLWTTINAENTTYRDGTAIPQVTDLNTWPNLTTGAWCYIDNDPSKGKLYNWFAVVGIHNEASLTDTSLRKEFAPQGWKIPSNDDFSLLVNYLIANGYNHDGTVTGNKLAKSLASQSGWGVTTGNGLPGTDQSLNNSSGFNALPVGVYRFNGTGWYFLNKGSEADFWTLTEHDSDEDLARYAALIFDRDWLTQWYIPKNNGASVRFIKE